MNIKRLTESSNVPLVASKESNLNKFSHLLELGLGVGVVVNSL